MAMDKGPYTIGATGFPAAEAWSDQDENHLAVFDRWPQLKVRSWSFYLYRVIKAYM